MIDYIVFVDADSGMVVPESDICKKCIIFGAGHMGIAYFDHISIKYNVVAFADNNPHLWGSIIHSVPVISRDELKHWTRDGDVDILACTYFANEIIIEQLKKMNLRARIIVPKLLEYVQDDENSLIDEKTFETLIKKSKQQYLERPRGETIKIVFLVHYLQLFSSYESIYEEMVEDNRFEPTIVLLPKRGSGEGHFFKYDTPLEEAMQKREYPYKMAYKDGQWLDLYSLDPDGIFYQTPYTFPQLPTIYREFNYSDHIKILHTPYGVLPVDDPSSLLGEKSGPYADFLNNCWRLFLDKPNYDAFINDPLITDKIVLTGTPKVDFYVRGIENSDIYFKDIKSKKILYTPTWMATQGRSSFLKYYDYFLQLIQKNGIELALRPHPLLIPELESTGLITKSELDRILDIFKNSENCLFDLYGDYRCALLASDFAIMDISSLTYEYLPTGKPLILTMQSEDRFGVKQFIKDASYIAENREQLEYFINILIAGEDPMREKRLQIINSLDSLFPNGGTNGAYICNYIAQNIRNT